jgi:hypothetical protein
MAGYERQDLEIRFDSVHDLSGSPPWWAVADTFFIRIPDQTEPQAVVS